VPLLTIALKYVGLFKIPGDKVKAVELISVQEMASKEDCHLTTVPTLPFNVNVPAAIPVQVDPGPEMVPETLLGSTEMEKVFESPTQPS
jgi:hypothetical protein